MAECKTCETTQKRLREAEQLLVEMDTYLRDIRAENLDGSEPALGELLERSLDYRLENKVR